MRGLVRWAISERMFLRRLVSWIGDGADWATMIDMTETIDEAGVHRMETAAWTPSSS